MSTSKNGPGEEIVLSYHDCLLRHNDLDLLRGSHWLNDAIIGFYFEYLEHSLDEIENDVLFVSPEMTQLLKLVSSSEFPALMDSLNAKERKYIFFPLNNCDSRVAAGGSHWSLLVVSKKEKTVFHLDSCDATNRFVATKFSNRLIDYLSDYCTKDLVELDCPQQENGYDCGLFTLCFADALVQRIRKGAEIVECNFDNIKNIVGNKRKELLHLINQLKSHCEKSQ